MKQPQNLKAISKKLHLPSGGGLKLYLENLMAAELVDKIAEITPDFRIKKTFHYYAVDEFLRFYQQFIKPHREEILHANRVSFGKLTVNCWFPFMGLAFERFCIKYRYLIAEILGIESKVSVCAPVLSQKKDGYQFDLVFLRTDNTLTLCEIKYLKDPPSTKLIREFDKKIGKTELKGRTLERILITNHPPSPSLEESGYFHRIIKADDIILAP